MSRMWMRIAGPIMVSLVLGACGAGSVAPADPSSAPPASAAAPTDATLVADLDVGGRTMHIVCLGPTDTGRPTVIFENGMGADFAQWGHVITAISQTDRACSYDRAGIGLSEAATTPRTTADQVADLRALLAAAAIQPPYVLVGHSLGGWNVLVHAGEHPDDVAGAVMVDIRPPDASRQWLAALPPEQPGESEALHQNRAEFTTFESDPSRNPEGLDLAASSAEARSVQLGDIPVAVLVAGGTSDLFWEGLDPELATTMHDIWMSLQEELAARSTAGTLEIVADSSHDIPGERPDAVIDAIGRVMAQLAG